MILKFSKYIIDYVLEHSSTANCHITTTVCGSPEMKFSQQL